jgi:hypothetical protein
MHALHKTEISFFLKCLKNFNYEFIKDSDLMKKYQNVSWSCLKFSKKKTTRLSVEVKKTNDSLYLWFLIAFCVTQSFL